MGSYRTSLIVGSILLVIVGLLCAPAAARVGLKGIQSGDTIYVGEESLDLTGLDPAVARLVHPDNSITVTDPDNFGLRAADVGTVTGTYAAQDAAGPVPGSPFVVVDVPSVTLDIVLNDTANSVDGISVTRDRPLAFRLENNLNGLHGGPPSASVAIETTLPNGTTVTSFGGRNLSSVPVRASMLFIPGIDLAGAEPGTYTARAVWTDGTGLAGKEYDSNTVRFEVLDPARITITVNVSGSGTYALGDEIVLNGTCDGGTALYLFLTGPNLGNGERLDMGCPVTDGNATTFTRVFVEANDTWEYRWDTAALHAVIDPGIYAVHATPEPRDAANRAQHAVVGVIFAMPTVTASVAPGDPLVISGNASGNPGNVYVWIFGQNLRVFSDPAGVAANGTFAYTLSPPETARLAPGRYDAVIQHPMMDSEQSVRFVPPGSISEPGRAPVSLEGLTPSDAEAALKDAFNAPAVDDTFAEVTFRIADSPDTADR
ncbi:DUF3821 domain-containing protein [Methanoculleus frigidifontis]|nr:DUF3821 domain-containing protein [Methanoculleus sp. FWC-SCC1]